MHVSYRNDGDVRGLEWVCSMITGDVAKPLALVYKVRSRIQLSPMASGMMISSAQPNKDYGAIRRDGSRIKPKADHASRGVGYVRRNRKTAIPSSLGRSLETWET